MRELLARISCPVLVIHGSDDAVRPCASGARLAELANGALDGPRGVGPPPPRARPGEGQPAAARLRRLPRRRRAAGCAASPAAGARSTSPLRSGSATRSATRRSPTSCASSIPTSRSTGWRSTRSRRCSRRAASGSIRPARFLANESHHIESESAEHDLHCFQAIRRMDEILLANFMVFHDLVREEQYDLWIGDEAWELDYYLHENPEQKRTPYVWLTDFVGWLPMPDGGDHEAFLTGDYNEEMIEHIARFPRVRDQARLRRQRRGHRPRAVRVAPALDPGVDRGALLVRRLRHGLRPGRVRRPRRTQGRARLRRGGAGLHRHGRRLGGRRRSAAAGDRRLPGGEGAGAGAADDRRRRAADRPGDAAARTTGSRSAPTSTTSTGTSPPAISPSSRAA